jgi:hypothetical protein
MSSFVRSFLLLSLLCLTLVGIAAADASPDGLTVNLSMSCTTNCVALPYDGQPGTPANGFADFNPICQPWNTCRSHGIAGNPVDLLICSVASRRQWMIHTIDLDFDRYAKYLPLKLLR